MDGDKLEAIETFYAGRKFRSRLEARHAIAFDAMRLTWHYEREGYKLDSGWYLPDFWMPEQDCFIEIKGEAPNKREISFARDLCISSGKRVFIFSGDIIVPTCGRHPLSAKLFYPIDVGGITECGTEENYQWCQCHFCEKFGIEFQGRSNRLPCKVDGTCERAGGNPDKGFNSASQDLIAGWTAAASAQFPRRAA